MKMTTIAYWKETNCVCFELGQGVNDAIYAPCDHIYDETIVILTIFLYIFYRINYGFPWFKSGFELSTNNDRSDLKKNYDWRLMNFIKML